MKICFGVYDNSLSLDHLSLKKMFFFLKLCNRESSLGMARGASWGWILDDLEVFPMVE
jgi:hypothetical protein